MSSSDGTMRPWDLDQYKPGSTPVVRPKRRDGGGDWDGVIRDGKQTRPTYEDDGTSLLWLAASTAFLTAITLGLYRFWMITRLRRYYWRAIRIEGDPLEYTGRGIEKFLGFLLAIVLLALYLGLVNLALTFVGLSLGNEIAIQLSILTALPLYYFAIYRARRYILSRTRWRGIRFGMEGGAWGFSLRAVGYLFLTIVSAGVLYPLMHFRLEKFMIDRSWFGDLKFGQQGSWLGLFAYWIWIYVVAGLVAVSAWGLAQAPEDGMSRLIGMLTVFGGTILILVLMLFYHVGAFRYLWSNRTLGEASFENDISSAGVLGIYIGGSIVVWLLTTIVGGLIAAAAALAVAVVGGVDLQAIETLAAAAESNEPTVLAAIGLPFVVMVFVIYIAFAATAYAFSQVFIRQPLIRRMAEAMTIDNPNQLRESRQREHDPATEAGGFADALGVDVGAGF